MADEQPVVAVTVAPSPELTARDDVRLAQPISPPRCILATVIGRVVLLLARVIKCCVIVWAVIYV